ncbi:exonuclease 3'-5' domain-containing protein 2-like [Macrobrachium nipponense]|uniref:exonuclease 3'-5' domain-containing protein 2-like n=1 Tax=Macrobrachium nipponense TaxID=159736 RepID=UPI0030C87850
MPLCMIDPKKARWYVTKGLGDLVSEDPLIVRLNFEPAGRPLMETQEGKFRLQERENICVVCGKDESYIRKNIVPHEYRKFFPNILKSHENHDIVLLCVECHRLSNVLDNTLRTQLAEEFSAPIGFENGAKATIDNSRKSVKHAASALVKCRNKMPEKRVTELENIVKEYFQVEDITVEHLDGASNLDVKIWNKDYQAHSQVVFEAYKKVGLVKLEQRWREHFLTSMKPRHMPDCWSVTHNAIKVRHKMSSLPYDHPDRELYKVVLVGTDGFIDVPYSPTDRENSPSNGTQSEVLFTVLPTLDDTAAQSS